jgi:hypothetical protein
MIPRLGRGDREPDTDRPAGRRIDCGINPDHLPLHVKQRAARIPFVDRRIGLDEIVVCFLLDIAAARGDDARRHRSGQTERVADRQNPVPTRAWSLSPKTTAGGAVEVYLQHRKIGPVIVANQLGLENGIVLKRHRDLVRVTDNMIVGDHDP